MQNNLFYLCGPHGSGKTTLGDKLREVDSRIVIPELFSRNVKFDADPRYRQYLKICGRAIENFEYWQIADKNPGKIILGNRCVYDVLAYNEVYHRRGWVDDETGQDYNLHASDFFQGYNSEPFAIMLNPGFEVCREHLKMRWKEKGKKWHEEDEKYLQLACEAYQSFEDNPRIFYVDYEVDLSLGVDVNRVIHWINEINSEVTV